MYIFRPEWFGGESSRYNNLNEVKVQSDDQGKPIALMLNFTGDDFTSGNITSNIYTKIGCMFISLAVTIHFLMFLNYGKDNFKVANAQNEEQDVLESMEGI